MARSARVKRETAPMRAATKRMLGAGVLAAAGYAVWRAFARRRVDTGVTWQAQPFPYPPQPRETTGATAAAAVERWVAPGDDGACPASHPVKAKLASGIFHVPGGANYDRTHADRCYGSAGDAERDGLRASKV
jgi:hypothetical protein